MSNYVITDLHGRYDLWQKVINKLQPEDTLYCLGDCADRGPDGWKIITEAIENPQVVYLKGNHEDMLAKAIKEYDEDCPDSYNNALDLSLYNGGTPTWKAWKFYTKRDKRWANQLNNLPYYDLVVNEQKQVIHLSHAGFNPRFDTPGWEMPLEKQLLWDRNHYKLTNPWHGRDNEYVIHGHTPMMHVRWEASREDIKPEIYADGHKINLDCASWSTGACILFNLDTFEWELIIV